jgi:hypothetical protein
MHADTLAELRAIMRGERAQSCGTDGTPATLTIVPAQKCPSFHAFHVFRPEQGMLRNEHFEPGTWAGTWPLPHDITEAERAAIALELGPRATNLCGRLGRLPNAKAGTCNRDRLAVRRGLRRSLPRRMGGARIRVRLAGVRRFRFGRARVVLCRRAGTGARAGQRRYLVRADFCA